MGARFSFWRVVSLVRLLCETASALSNLFLHISREVVGFPTVLRNSAGERKNYSYSDPRRGREIQWGNFIGVENLENIVDVTFKWDGGISIGVFLQRGGVLKDAKIYARHPGKHTPDRGPQP